MLLEPQTSLLCFGSAIATNFTPSVFSPSASTKHTFDRFNSKTLNSFFNFRMRSNCSQTRIHTKTSAIGTCGAVSSSLPLINVITRQQQRYYTRERCWWTRVRRRSAHWKRWFVSQQYWMFCCNFQSQTLAFIQKIEY